MHDPASRYTVVLVEDEPILREELSFQLEHQGFRVQAVESAAALYRVLAVSSPVVVVLDIGLEGEDGLQVCSYLRAHDSRMGIVFVTARAAREDRLAGLALGADAYLVKPIDIDELALILRRLMAREPDAAPPVLLAASCEPPAAAWQLTGNGLCLEAPNGQTLLLTFSEQRLLQTLMARQGEACSYAELGGALQWPNDEFDKHRLEVIVSRLRAKVERQCGQRLPLQTERNFGYRLQR